MTVYHTQWFPVQNVVVMSYDHSLMASCECNAQFVTDLRHVGFRQHQNIDVTASTECPSVSGAVRRGTGEVVHKAENSSFQVLKRRWVKGTLIPGAHVRVAVQVSAASSRL